MGQILAKYKRPPPPPQQQQQAVTLVDVVRVSHGSITHPWRFEAARYFPDHAKADAYIESRWPVSSRHDFTKTAVTVLVESSTGRRFCIGEPIND
jgi:hypothetical protein